MNHVEALKVARDALEKIHDATSVDVWSAVQATQALKATAFSEPVAESIDTDEMTSMLRGFYHAAANVDKKGLRAVHGDIIRHIDQHCAAQVAQALAAVDPVAQTLMRAGHAPEEAMRLAIDGRINAALAAKPAPTDAEIEAMVVWLGDPADPYFDRIAFARALLAR